MFFVFVFLQVVVGCGGVNSEEEENSMNSDLFVQEFII